MEHIKYFDSNFSYTHDSLKSKELYLVDELKSLKVGDRVVIEFRKGEFYLMDDDAEVVMINNDSIYFGGGLHFPLYPTFEVETKYAVIDIDEHMLKIFKK